MSEARHTLGALRAPSVSDFDLPGSPTQWPPEGPPEGRHGRSVADRDAVAPGGSVQNGAGAGMAVTRLLMTPSVRSITAIRPFKERQVM